MEQFIEFLLIEEGLSQKTMEAYVSDLQQLADYATRPLQDLTAEEMIVYFDSLTIDRRSQLRKRSSFRKFYLFLVQEKVRLDNPMEKIPRMVYRAQGLVKALSEEEIAQLFVAVHQDQSYAGVRTALALEILYSTGIRISELLHIRLVDVLDKVASTQRRETFYVQGKGGKMRLAVLHTRVRKVLSRYVGMRDSFLERHRLGCSIWLFPGDIRGKKNLRDVPITRQRMFQILKQLAHRAGLDDCLVSPHVIRHSFATHLLRHGMELRFIQELMGHSSITSTQIYTQLSLYELDALVSRQHPLNLS